jgi:hypothetical protein
MAGLEVSGLQTVQNGRRVSIPIPCQRSHDTRKPRAGNNATSRPIVHPPTVLCDLHVSSELFLTVWSALGDNKKKATSGIPVFRIDIVALHEQLPHPQIWGSLRRV